MAPIALATDLRKIPRIPSTARSIRATLRETLLQSTMPSSVRSAYRGCWWNRAHEEDIFGGAAAEPDCDDTSSIRTVVPHVLEMMEEEDEGHMARQGEQQRHEEEEPLRCQSSRICRNDHRLQYLQGTVIPHCYGYHEVRFLKAPIYDFKKFMLPDRQRRFFGLLLEVIEDPCRKLGLHYVSCTAILPSADRDL